MKDDTKVYMGSLRGVGCAAVNCQYHSAGNSCSASHISVAADNAMRKGETFCSTFTLKAT